MLHPSHLDIVYKRFEKMDFEPKKIRKYYKELLLTFGRKCRMKIGKYHKEFDKGLLLIDALLSETMRKPYCFSNGNVFLVGSFIDNFILNLEDMNKRICTINNNEILLIAHEQILEKQNELINVLDENLKNPIHVDELNDILNGGVK